MEGLGVELAPGLHRVEAPLGERFVACYLIVGARAALLVDTGVVDTPARSLLPYCQRIGLQPARVRWVVVSHCDVDHMGGDASARARFPEAALVAHAADRALIEDVGRIVEERYREFAAPHGIDIDAETVDWCHTVARAAPMDLVVEGAVTIDLGERPVTVLPTPGHSPGSVSVHDPTSGAVMTSDAVLGRSLHLRDGRPAFPPTYRLAAPYRATIAALEALRPAWLLTAHEPVMDAAAGLAFLAASRAFADELEAQMLAELEDAGRPLTLRELIERLAPRVGAWEPSTWDLLAHPLAGHLEEAVAAGRIDLEPGPPACWTPAPAGAGSDGGPSRRGGG
jgi:glyoxylase-like metal-dependent hydrolase (beta-lactamase superfamily II)